MSSNQESTLEEVLILFEDWRRHKASLRERIPTELWNQAISLIPSYGTNRVSKDLGLNPGSLKRESDKRKRLPSENPPRVDFVEVGFEKSPLVSPVLKCHRVEFERPDGSRMNLYAGEQAFEASSLLHIFLGGPPCFK